MFYEEKWIRGRLYYRGTPDGDWTEADPSMLHCRLQEAEEKLKRSHGPKSVSPTEVSVARFLTWVKSCDRGLMGDSKIAIAAQIRVLQQLIGYLQGDEYIAACIADAEKRTDATGIPQEKP